MKDISGVQGTEIFLSPQIQRGYKFSKQLMGGGEYI